jgi:predicted AlkP superfamily pyrophosphatase or phosphodiesterase
MRNGLLLLLLLGLAASVAGCVDSGDEEPPPLVLVPKVLVLGLDGLRGDAIPETDSPRLASLLEGGAGSYSASTQITGPTVSGPGWASILMGVEPQKHGVYDNTNWQDFDRSYVTFIARAQALGFSTATAINWLPIQTSIIEDDVTDEIVLGTDQFVADGMAGLLRDADHDVHFVHFDDADHSGHASGFSVNNPDYVATVEILDTQVGQLLDAIAARDTRAEESWLVMLTSDHGGEGTSHGGITADHRAIPLLVFGDSVAPVTYVPTNDVPGEMDVGFVSHLDVHPTVLHHLGHPPEPDWVLDGFVRGLE